MGIPHKHIKISGKLKSRGEYSMGSDEYRPYDAVTIVDDHGYEIHFTVLIIPKRLDEHIIYNKHTNFYILRIKDKLKMYGVLYAIKSEDKKIFYNDLAVSILKSFVNKQSLRCQLVTQSPIGFTVCLFIGAGIMTFILHFIVGISTEISSALSFLAIGAFLLFPFFTSSSRAKLSEMYGILEHDGFSITSGSVSKY